MISVILFFLLLCSGSVLAAAFRGRRFEEVLPLTCGGIVLVLYVCGLLGALAFGAALVCVLAVCAYVASAARLFRAGGWGKFRRDFFSLPLWLFALLYLFFVYCQYGRLAYEWDAFSHWMDTVKIMVVWDDFGTNPQANALFPSYPPGLALFEYMFQKLSQFTGSPGLCEWKVYLAYDVFLFAFLWPFTGLLDRKKPFVALASCALVFICPAVFFPTVYNFIYADPVLGVLSGAGLATVALQKKWDALSSARIWAACAMLVLVKDAGLLFALFLAGAYILSLWTDGGDALPRTRRLVYSALAVAAVALPKLSWRGLLRSGDTPVLFSAPYDLPTLFGVITGRDDTYRGQVWHNFLRACVTPRKLGYLGIKVSYLALFLLLAGVIFLAVRVLVRHGAVARRRAAVVLPVLALQFAVYVPGLAFTYIARFSAYEAVNLASFDRYMGIPYLSGLALAVLLILAALPLIRPRGAVAAAALAGMLLVAPINNLGVFLLRTPVRVARENRSQLAPLVRAVEEYTPEDAAVWLVAQGDNGYSFYMFRYDVRPRIVANRERWSIGEPGSPEDLYTVPMSPREWRETLAESYDYVAVYQLNDSFYKNYASVFANPGDIAENTLYRVNKDTGLLEKCGL